GRERQRRTQCIRERLGELGHARTLPYDLGARVSSREILAVALGWVPSSRRRVHRERAAEGWQVRAEVVDERVAQGPAGGIAPEVLVLVRVVPAIVELAFGPVVAGDLAAPPPHRPVEREVAALVPRARLVDRAEHPVAEEGAEVHP